MTTSTPVDPLGKAQDGDWLSVQEFPPLRWAIPGIIPEGLSLLVGPPKAGKSFAALDLLLSIAAGGRALGKIPTGRPRRVFYLALEDSHRRMQDRCRHLLKQDTIPPLFSYMTAIEPTVGLPLTIEAWMERHPDTSLVVVDTLGKVMPPSQPGESSYNRDYRIASRLKAVADASPGLSILVLHHDRKATSDDFVDNVSGTHGLAGAADTITVLARKRNSSEGVLKITGRDVIESEYALRFADDGTGWILDGADLSHAAEIAMERSTQTELSADMHSVLALVNEHPEGITAKAVVDKLGKNAYTYLRRLADDGSIEQPNRGAYCPVAGPALFAVT